MGSHQGVFLQPSMQHAHLRAGLHCLPDLGTGSVDFPVHLVRKDAYRRNPHTIPWNTKKAQMWLLAHPCRTQKLAVRTWTQPHSIWQWPLRDKHNPTTTNSLQRSKHRDEHSHDVHLRGPDTPQALLEAARSIAPQC